MEKLTNSIKIAYIRRSNLSSEANEHKLSLKKYSIKTYPESQHRNSYEQVLKQQISDPGPRNSIFHNQKSISSPRTIRAISVNESNGKNTVSTSNTNVANSVRSSFSSLPIKKTNTNSKEIPCKTKWSTRKKIILGLLALPLLGVLVAIPTVLGILLTRQTVTTTTAATTTASSSSVTISASWSFDNTTTDLYNVYNGQLVNGATYSPNTTAAPYVGINEALSLTSSSNQSVLVATPFFNLTFTSFTIEAWIYPMVAYSGDRGIFSQCYCSSCMNQCLYVLVRSNRLYAGFTLNDIASSSTLTMSTWYHIAFIYNYQTQQQILYINGVQDTIKSNARPYQGLNATIQIGVAQVSQTMNFFNGYIDNVYIITRAKSSTEILNDATLAAYYSFDMPYSNMDRSPNGLNGTSVSTITVNGRVNEAMRVTGTSSYFQVYNFYRFGYATLLSKPFSVSMWINPSLITSSTIVQMSSSQLAGSCTNMFGLMSSSGINSQIIAQSPTSQWSYVTMIGPFISINTWTHISWTFSSSNGYSLYVNGIYFGSTGASSSNTVNQMVWLYIGYSQTCSTSYFTGVGYQGSIDEVYFHTRELTQTDVTALANP